MALFDSLIAEIDSKLGLRAESSALVAEVIRVMTSEPGSGHTDNTGILRRTSSCRSSAREVVRAVLIETGVPEHILTAKGHGNSKPKASNDTAEGRYQNRRIEYAVLP